MRRSADGRVGDVHVADGESANGGPAGNFEFLEVYREGFRRTPEAAVVVDVDRQIVDLNRSAEKLLGYGRMVATGRTGEELGWWVDAHERAEVLQELDRSGTVVRRVRLRRRDGVILDVYAAGTTLNVGGQRFAFWIGRDVTGQRLSAAEAAVIQEALLEATRERRRLVARLIHAADHERARLSDELRAGPIQQLTASQIALEAADAAADADRRAVIERVRASIAGAIHDLRRITTELRPPLLEREGLGPAVRALLFEFNDAYDLEFDLDDRTGGDAPAETSAIAYRLVFEILVAVRDAGGRLRVRTALGADADAIDATIVVVDTTPEPGATEARLAPVLETFGDLLTSLGGSLDVWSSASEMTVRATIPRVAP
jgi:PAS domain S-box-containing protein